MKFIKENFDRSTDLERRIADYKLKYLNEFVEEKDKKQLNEMGPIAAAVISGVAKSVTDKILGESEKTPIEESKKYSYFEVKYKQAGATKINSDIKAEDISDAMKKFTLKHLKDKDPIEKIISCEYIENITIDEDVKKLPNGKWANVGKDGKVDSGKFKTKKEADAQRKAMFANGYKESIIRYPNGMEVTDVDLDKALDYQYGTDRDKDNSKYTDDEKQKAVTYWIKKTDSSPYDDSTDDLEELSEKLDWDSTIKVLKQHLSKIPKGAMSRANISDVLVAYCNYSSKEANDFVAKLGVSGVRNLIDESLSKEEVEPLEEKTEEYLTEDVEIEIETKDEPKVEVEDSDEHSIKNVPEMPTTDCKMVVANILNPLIKDELEAIDGYNSAVATFRSMMEDETTDKSIDYKGIIAVISEITNEENLHIGQLEKLLETVSPNAKSIDDGKDEAAEQLEETSDKKEEEVEVEEKTEEEEIKE